MINLFLSLYYLYYLWLLLFMELNFPGYMVYISAIYPKQYFARGYSFCHWSCGRCYGKFDIGCGVLFCFGPVNSISYEMQNIWRVLSCKLFTGVHTRSVLEVSFLLIHRLVILIPDLWMKFPLICSLRF